VVGGEGSSDDEGPGLMRLLHVSDWHLGATLGRLSRAQDHEEVLDEMVGVAREWRPHLIVHSGDLFEHARPAVEDLQRGVEALRRMAEIASVVVLAGNHDSPALFEVFDRLLALGSGSGPGGPSGRDGAAGAGSRVRFLGRARPPDRGGILTLPGADGEEARLAALPFVHPHAVLDAFDVAPERRSAAYADQVHLIEKLLGEGLRRGYDAGRHVLLFAAHLHVGGARFSGSERPLHVTRTYATSVTHVPKVTYAAFGHLHQPQPLPGRSVTGRFAGSPIQIDYGEEGEAKSVVAVEATPGRRARVETVPLRSGRPLRRVSGSLEELARLDDVGRSILAAVVDTEEPVPDLADRISALFPRATLFDVVDRFRTAGVEVAEEGSGAEAEPPIRELFRDYMAGVGVAATAVDRVMSVFGRLLDAVETETEPAFDEVDAFEPPATLEPAVEHPTPVEAPAAGRPG
jgi:DNA repair protein SbcD/Mre11